VDGVLGLAESSDGILGYQFNKRLESFAPCSMLPLLLGEYEYDFLEMKNEGRNQTKTRA
jgi:hypothetical protein